VNKLGFPGENSIIFIPAIETQTKTVVGVKYDGEKPRMELLPPRSLKEVSKVLTFGAKKYAPDNWKKLDNLRTRYLAGALRHITDEMIQEGHKDEESGIDGIAHAICCLMFILEKRLEDAEKSS
jgi:hypothetical protein